MYIPKIALQGIALCSLLLCGVFQGCTGQNSESLARENSGNADSQDQFPVYLSYKDIPGVTREEINAIEEFQRNGRSFVYGMSLASECFEDSGSMAGFSALFCRELGNLFALDFTPAVFERADLIAGLETGAIDFTGELSATPDRLKTYFMTGAITERALIITRLAGSPDPAAIALSRRPRFGFLSNSDTLSMVQPALLYEFDAVDAASADDVHNLLRAGQIDAFIEEGYEGAAAIQSDFTSAEMLPPIYNPVSMAARKAELKPVISVVQKYLDSGARNRLAALSSQGRKEYVSRCFYNSLTKEETDYVETHNGKKGEVIPIPFVMERDNYPWAFYDANQDAWQGIAWDVLKQIESLSGLRFEPANSRDDTWPENFALLENGGGKFITQLLRTGERKDRFLWPDAPYAKDNFAILSRQDTPDVSIGEVFNSRVGLMVNSAYREYFLHWFPNHPHIVEYQNKEDGLEALKKGEIDLYMGTKNTLLDLTNYREDPEYKVNMLFYQTADSYFGFNRNEKLLCSIISKAQRLVNTELVEARWLSRIYDYRNKFVRERQPYLIVFSVLMGAVVFLLIALLQKDRESKLQLKVLVRQRTRELEIQKNASQTAYKVKNRFLANMSHEIRTPLNAIIGLSQTELEKAPPESKENLSSISRSGSLLLDIINDLLDISNIESGQIELKCADYSLPMVISSAAESAKFRIGNKNIKLHLEADEDLPVKLHGDNHRIIQILGNLLSNAVKFTNEGSVLFRIGYENQEEEDKLTLIFEVCDTGIGIKNDHMERLFTDYNQADTETTRSTSGTGMGLLIAKKLAVLMGGDIHVTSEYGKGSIFTAWIPQTIAVKTAIGSDTAEKLSTFSWKETQGERRLYPYARVLVVDDVAINHAVARGIMRPYKMTVDTALSGQESINLIAAAEVHYDAIFMDHMMPGMDGIEAAKHIRELDTDYSRSIPIIALTANALPENEELFLSSGFNAYMTKPINIGVLDSVLNQWVRDEEKDKLCVIEQEEEEQPQSSILSAHPIEGVDVAAGVAQFGGEENYLEIVKVFVNDTPKLLENVQNFLDKFRIMPAAAAAALESLKNYTITVHGIKGSCYGICAAPVGDLAKELEMAAKSQNLGRVLELNNEFVKATEKLVGELKGILPHKEDKPKLEKESPDPAVLQKLLKAAESYNITEILAALDELEQYRYLENNDLVLELRQAADNYEYLDLIKLLSSIPETGEETEIYSGTAG